MAISIERDAPSSSLPEGGFPSPANGSTNQNLKQIKPPRDQRWRTTTAPRYLSAATAPPPIFARGGSTAFEIQFFHTLDISSRLDYNKETDIIKGKNPNE